MLIPAVKKHYRGKGIKKYFLCVDGCKCMNNVDKARARGKGHFSDVTLFQNEMTSLKRLRHFIPQSAFHIGSV